MLHLVLSHRMPVAMVALVAVMSLAVACGGGRDADDGGDRAALTDRLETGRGAGAEQIGAAPPADEKDGSLANNYDSGASAPSSSGGGAALPAQLDRKIIRTATVSLETERVAQQFEQVGNIAAGAGGFVASSSFGNDGDQQIASVTIRVPGDRYQDVLIQLRRLGDVTSEQSGASDITEEYTDLQSRLRNLQASEQRYLDLLARATTIDEILTVQDRINATRAEIEQVQGRIQLLDNQVDLATITVHLAPPALAKTQPADGGGIGSPREVAREAFDASIGVLSGVAAVAVAVAVFSWWLVPLAAVAAYAARRWRERQRGAAPQA